MRLISYSLWGTAPKYLVGALRNAELAAALYPGWTARFAVGASVPRETVAGLRERGAEVVERHEPGDWRALFWRFEPAADARVEALLSRDCDSRLAARERAAVEVWLSGEAQFHVMRDHPWHRMPILGGTFGARGPVLRELSARLQRFERRDRWNSDQEFLALAMWPLVRKTALVHDEFFAGRPFPTRREGLEFVGQVFDEHEKSPPQHAAALQRALAQPR